MTASQRAQAIKRRKQIWEALHPVDTGGKTFSTCLSDGRKAGPQHEQGFAAATATAAGMTKQAIKRRKQIWEALHPNSGKSVSTIPDRGPGRPKEFAAATAEAAGMTKQAINQHLARAEAIGDDLERVTGTSLARWP